MSDNPCAEIPLYPTFAVKTQPKLHEVTFTYDDAYMEYIYRQIVQRHVGNTLKKIDEAIEADDNLPIPDAF